MDIIKLCFLVIILTTYQVLSVPVSQPGLLKPGNLRLRRAAVEGPPSPAVRSTDAAEGDLETADTFIGFYGGGWGGWGGGWGGYGYPGYYGGYGSYGWPSWYYG